jgi:hypothetical protein
MELPLTRDENALVLPRAGEMGNKPQISRSRKR